MFALVLADYAPPGADISRVIAMLLVHDIVEIDAGDAFVYDEEAKAQQPARERAAADRLYGILPPSQGRNLQSLWEEFEARQTPKPASPPPSTASSPCFSTSTLGAGPGANTASLATRSSPSTPTSPTAPRRCGPLPAT